jgi:hypothetical protein
MLTAKEREEIIKLHKDGWNKNRIANKLNISWDTADRVIKRGREKTEQGVKRGEEEASLGMRFSRYSSCIELKEELETMKENIRTHASIARAGGYFSSKHEMFIKKVDWLLKQLDPERIEEASDVVKGLREEYEKLMGEKDPKSEYHSIKVKIGKLEDELERKKGVLEDTEARVVEFEKEKGMSLRGIRDFIEANKGLVTDFKKLEERYNHLKDEEEAWHEGCNAGKEAGLKLARALKEELDKLGYTIDSGWIYCPVCKKPIHFFPGSDPYIASLELQCKWEYEHAVCRQWAKERGIPIDHLYAINETLRDKLGIGAQVARHIR